MSSNTFTFLGAFEVVKLATLAVPLWLFGCAVGPNYKAPDAAVTRVPAAWHAKVPHGGTVAELNLWWARVDDPALGHLVDAAENNSPTLALAVGRVRAARAGLQASRASFMPAVFGSGSYNRDKNVTQVGSIATTTSGVLNASWELDVFGGARRNYEASQAQFSAAEFGWHDARVSLAAEVANSFTTVRLYQNLIARYEQELASRRSTQELTAAKVREGMSPPTTAYLTEASTSFAASTLENQRGLFRQTLNLLVMLTGLSYDEVETTIGQIREIPHFTQAVELAVPANSVSQRPDIRAAEGQLMASSAKIGVAIADALPSLSLGGFIGINTVRIDSFEANVTTWQYGPSLSLPVFTGGAYRAKIEAARAEYDQSLAIYRSAVANAVREIEDTLVRIDAVIRRRGYAEDASKNFRAYFLAMEQSYKEGNSSLLEFEDARRQSLSSEESLLSVLLEEAQSWIALYKAAGGGWNEAMRSRSQE